DQMCQDVMELKKEGLSYVQIAEILGYDKGTIRQQLKKRILVFLASILHSLLSLFVCLYYTEVICDGHVWKD
ncbi:hypothetical protein ACUODJ_48010, partial [Escherichia sp. HC-CC]